MDCIFCQIAQGRDSSFVYSDDTCVAFLDIEPWQRGHTLVIPRQHVADMLEGPEVFASIAPGIAAVSRLVVDKLGADGCNVMINSRPVSGQSVFHLHAHVIPRYDAQPGLQNLVPKQVRRADADELADVYAAIDRA